MGAMRELVLLLLSLAAPAWGQSPPLARFELDSAGTLLGRRVFEANGQEIGRMVDVVVDRDGRPVAALIDVGGFMGIGIRRVAVGWETLRFNHAPGDTRIIELLSLDEVAAAPEVKPDTPIQAIGRRP